MLLAIGTLTAAVGYGVYQTAEHLCATRMARPTDDLGWLRLEFKLDTATMARIRQLHSGYLPICRGYCEQIAAKKRELEASLAGAPGVSAAAEKQLAEIGSLRAQCQAAMLRHFEEVSREMPPAQGQRYLAEMRRLTLGSHEQIEASMAPSGAAGHDHH
jgi:hypothetical protein